MPVRKEEVRRAVGPVDVLRARLLIGLETGDAGGVEPEAVVVDLGQQVVDDGQVARADIPVFAVGLQRRVRRRRNDERDAAGGEQLADLGEIGRTGGQVQDGLGAVAVDAPAAVVGLDLDALLTGRALDARGRGLIDTEGRLLPVDGHDRLELVGEVVDCVVDEEGSLDAGVDRRVAAGDDLRGAAGVPLEVGDGRAVSEHVDAEADVTGQG